MRPPSSPGERRDALLLLGPTGSGKTPLGELLEIEGLGERACHHLDFGARLRAVARGALRPAGLAGPDVEVVRHALAAGALLEDASFPIAAAIVRDLFVGRPVPPDDLVVLNGLPRHVGQARDLEAWLDVRRVVHLDATPDALLERIRRNAGGDRRERPDDTADAVRARLRRFEERTRPLLDHYEARGVPVTTLEVGPGTQAAGLAAALEGV